MFGVIKTNHDVGVNTVFDRLRQIAVPNFRRDIRSLALSLENCNPEPGMRPRIGFFQAERQFFVQEKKITSTVFQN